MSRVEVSDANPLDDGSSENSVENAAEAFASMLAEEETPRRRETKREASPRRSEPDNADADDGEGDEAPDTDTEGDGEDPADHDEFLDGEKPDGDDDEEGEGDDEGDDDADEDADEDDEDEDDEFDDWDRKVTFDGPEGPETVTLGELRDRGLRDADYRRKSMGLAEERKEVEEYAKEVVAERKHYADTVQGFIDLTEALKPDQAEWDRLEKENPQAFIATKRTWDAITAKVTAAQAERDNVAAAEQAENERKFKAYVQRENKELAKKVPALANPKKAKVFRERIMAYAKEAGYSEEEVFANAIDHRDVLTLYRAAKFMEIEQSRKAGQRKPDKKGPKAAGSTTRPRSTTKSSASKNRQRLADRRAARSGSVEDAALSFEAMLRS